MDLALKRELEEKKLINLLGLHVKSEWYQLLELKCQLCGTHLGFMAHFKSDRIYPEFMCDKCKNTVVGSE